MSDFPPNTPPVNSSDQQTRLWGMILHLSQLAGFAVPIAGFVAPIVIWQIKKAEMPALDEHGKMIANWIISELIYGVAGVILIVVLIGLPILMALGAVAIAFPIIGGVKANNGELWKYPLTIKLIK